VIPEISLDSWSIFFMLAAAQGIFLSVVFFIKRNSQPEILLNILVLLFSITLIDYVAFWTNFRFEFPHVNRISSAFPFLFGPLFYLYIRSFINSRDLDRKDLIHALPFVFHLFILIPYYVLDGSTKIEMLLNRQIFLFENEFVQTVFLNIAYVLPIVMTLHLGIYTISGFKLISKKDLSNVKESVERWLTILAYSFIGFTISFASYYIMVYLFSYNLAYDYAISVSMSVFIYAIGYFGFISPEVLEGDIESHTEKGKYSNSGLTQSGAKKLKEELLKLMEDDKFFLKTNLKLKDLANAVDQSKHHVSQVINDELETTFSAFVNEYRIKESKKLLLNKNEELNMYGIAKESGFNNKTTFSLAFKRHTGLTPSLYQKKFQDSK